MAKQSINTILCPKCNKKITLNEAIMQPFLTEMNENFEKNIIKKEQEIKKLKSDAEKKIEEAIKKDKHRLEKEAEKKAKKNIKKEIVNLQEQVKEKEYRIKESEKYESELRKEKRKLEEEKEKFEIESERKLDEERKKIYEDAEKKTKEESEREYELKIMDEQKKNEDLKKVIAELKKKSEQGSQKLQGEVLEQELENILKKSFLNDKIQAISSGIRGADILQKICLNNGKPCGNLLLESKRAGKWSNKWIDKLKDDQRNSKAEVGIIVSTILPEGIINFGYIKGTMVVDYKFVIPVVMMLRRHIIEISREKFVNTDRNQKMELLYSYLTGNEFRQKVEMVIESFDHMWNDLQAEKRAMTRIWEKREKQLGKAVTGVAGMYGDMQGIGGTSFPEIKNLELKALPESIKNKKKL